MELDRTQAQGAVCKGSRGESLSIPDCITMRQSSRLRYAGLCKSQETAEHADFVRRLSSSWLESKLICSMSGPVTASPATTVATKPNAWPQPKCSYCIIASSIPCSLVSRRHALDLIKLTWGIRDGCCWKVGALIAGLEKDNGVTSAITSYAMHILNSSFDAAPSETSR